MGKEVIMVIVFGVVFAIAGIWLLISRSKKTSNVVKETKEITNSNKSKDIKRVEKPVEQRDMSEFIKFDKIANDMIYQNNGERYTMIIQCKGVNYHLMSEIEQMAVEEGFIMFLNTLKYPIQLYVQTKSVDLSENVKAYKEKVKEFSEKQNEVSDKYNEVEDDVDSTQEEIDYMKKEKLKYTNIAEYVSDITRYVEKMALNKYMLQRSFYIIFSYNKAELGTTEEFTKEEYEDLCYRELYTRAQAILGSLMTCSVSGRILTSNEIAQLVYTSLNKDDANLLSIKDALASGIFRLYTSSEDVLRKRTEMIDAELEEQARMRVEEAVKIAMQKGLIVSKDENMESIEKELDKRALKIIDKSSVDENIKQQLKNTIRENRKNRIKKIKQSSENESEQITQDVDVKDEDNNSEEIKVKAENTLISENTKIDITDNDTIIDDELIIETKEGENDKI